MQRSRRWAASSGHRTVRATSTGSGSRAAIGAHAWTDAWMSGRACGVETIVEELLSGRRTGAVAPAATPVHSDVDELTHRAREVTEMAARDLSNRRMARRW